MNDQQNKTVIEQPYFGWWMETDGVGFPSLFKPRGAKYSEIEMEQIQRFFAKGFIPDAYKTHQQPCPFGGRACNAIHNEVIWQGYASDGVLVWNSTLAHLVAYHGVILPLTFFQRIRTKPDRLSDDDCLTRIEPVYRSISSIKSQKGWLIRNFIPIMLGRYLILDRKLNRELISAIKNRAIEKKSKGDLVGYWEEMNPITESLTRNERLELNALLFELISNGAIEFHGISPGKKEIS